MSKRYYQFDNLKFFLILCVVVGHFVDLHIKSPDFKSLFIFICTFHMPLFLFIAGMFHKNTNIAKKVVSYIILGYIYKIAIFVTRFYIYGNRDIKIYFLSETGAPWFMFAMAVFTLISYLLRDVNKKSLFVLWVLIACFTGYDSNVGTHLILSRLIVFFPFYHLGTMIKPDVLQSISSKKTHKLLALVVVIAYGLLCVVQLDRIYLLRHLFTGQNPFQAAIYPYGCAFRLLCYLITTVVSLALIVHTPPQKIPVISEFGTRTLQVYFWHIIFLYVLLDLNIVSLCSTTLGKCIFVLISILLTFVLSLKPFSFPLKYIQSKL